ncbi:MAG: hypothetical protein JOZ38_04205 [Candidatus Eremiobacteraeota bacterium]|nr:hypothetical protein [Candidatus Eremiobacteraeota bacterium]
MTLLCVTVPTFRLQVAMQTYGVEACSAILADKRDRGHVIELNDAAKRSGARTGMTLVAAQAAASDAALLVHDPVRSGDVWRDVLDALDTVSPLIDDTAEGVAYLHMVGAAGTPQDWIANARAALEPFALPLRIAVGSNKFVARAAAFVGDGVVCAPGKERATVAPLPLEVLPDTDPQVLERLELLGIRTLGELAKLPHGPFVRRFGSRAARWHRHAQGVDMTPFLPRAHEISIEASTYGDGTAETEEQVYFALRVLVGRVQEDLSHLGKRAGALQLRIECDNGEARELTIHIATPTSAPQMLFDLAKAKVEGQTFESPIAGLRLQACRLEEGGAPTTLFASNGADPAAVALALARLESAFGVQPVAAKLQPAHALEAQFAYERFDGPPERVRSESALPAAPIPQMRLLHVKEIPVQMVRNAPAFVGAQAVVDFAGPWRIDEQWFQTPLRRDEYDVLLDDGALYRIFKQGERWYLRGAYD